MSWIAHWIIASHQSPAIAFDSTSQSWWTGTQTFAHTIWPSANRILFVWVSTTSLNSITWVTYNWSSLTLIASRFWWSWNFTSWLYYIINPPTGTANIVASTTWWWTQAAAASYSWAKQTWIPDAFSTAFSDSVVSSFTSSVTVVWSWAWHICWATANTSSISAWALTTQRTSSAFYGIFDSNQKVSWTSVLNINNSSNAIYTTVGASFLPA